MSEISHVFDQQIRGVVLPLLKEQGFAFDRSRTFRRVLPDGAIQVINFQMGQRSRENEFTVNLGVYRPGDPVDAKFSFERVMEYQCNRRTRLSELRTPAFASLRKIPILGLLFGGADPWWQVSSAEQITRRSLEKVLDMLVRYGLPWLERQ